MAIIVVRALRAAGHDVLAITETALGRGDDEVFALAAAEAHLILTEDLDFGRFVGASELPGLVLLHFEARTRTLIAEASAELFAERGDQRRPLRRARAGTRPLLRTVARVQPLP